MWGAVLHHAVVLAAVVEGELAEGGELHGEGRTVGGDGVVECNRVAVVDRVFILVVAFRQGVVVDCAAFRSSRSCGPNSHGETRRSTILVRGVEMAIIHVP